MWVYARSFESGRDVALPCWERVGWDEPGAAARIAAICAAATCAAAFIAAPPIVFPEEKSAVQTLVVAAVGRMGFRSAATPAVRTWWARGYAHRQRSGGVGVLAVADFATDRIADRALDVRHECGLHQLLVAPSGGMAERFAQAV